MTKIVAKSGYSWVRSLSNTMGLLGAGTLLLSVVSILPAAAQTAGSLNQTGGSDVNSTFGDNDGLDMFELMHRAQQGQIRNSSEFSQDQQESISNEAVDFRTRQLEAVEQQQIQDTSQPAETNPAPPEPSSDNQL